MTMNRSGGSSSKWAVLGAVALLTLPPNVPSVSAQGALEAVGQPMEHKFLPQLRFSPDGKRLLAMGGASWLWDVSTQTIVGDAIMGPDRKTGADRPKGAKLEADKYSAVIGADFTPDGKSLIVLSHGFIQRWDADKGRPQGKGIAIVSTLGIATTKLDILNGPVAFRADGKVALVQYSSTRTTVVPGKKLPPAKWEEQGWLINTTTGKRVGAPLPYGDDAKSKNRPPVRALAAVFKEDGKQVVTLHDSKEVHIWDAATGKSVSKPLQLPKGGLRQLAPDGKTLATFDTSKLDLWDLEEGKVVGTLNRLGSQGSAQLAFSADSRTLAMFNINAKGHEEIHVLAVPSLKVQATFGHKRTVRQLLFSPDGKLLLSIAEDASAHLLDAATGKLRGSVKDQVKGIGNLNTAVFSPDGTLLAISFATPNPDRVRVQLWRLPGEGK